MWARPYVVVSAVVAGSLVTVIGWRFALFILPFSWTGEAERMARLMELRPGSTVADIGAGDGAFAVEMARVVTEKGVVYATELSADRRRAIARRVERAGVDQVEVLEAAVDATHLPDACCDAVYLRTVFHHIADKATFAEQVVKSVRPGGRVVVIDFPPGALWFHGRDHGVSLDDVLRSFQQAGLVPLQRIDNWGGGMFMLLFERSH
jgi:ubiquinone/menaquinone biosynthesis C-methylase UbiE